jgi:hypothetical protein
MHLIPESGIYIRHFTIGPPPKSVLCPDFFGASMRVRGFNYGSDFDDGLVGEG